VQDTHISKQLRVLHSALLRIVSVMNRPERDEVLIKKAGIRLDRALFPLLVGIERAGPIGVVDLAGRLGRNYTTVSRQVTKLEGLGLAKRRGNPTDGRVSEAVITRRGKEMAEMVDAARQKIGLAIFKTWDAHDFNELVRLIRRFADAIEDEPSADP
jgi:DNA-binding MarR family transcriptional regulator